MTTSRISDDELLYESKKEAKERSERNPCRKEINLSLKCLDENYYNKEKCAAYFQNYKICKAFWGYVSKERKKNGIRPSVPPPEDRERVKAEYLPQFKW